MTPAFVAVATLLAVATAVLIAWPLVRKVQVAGAAAPDWRAAAVAATLVLGGAVALYATWSNWNWPTAPQGAATTPAEMVTRLASRLESQPDDLEGWIMLGRSYAALEQFPLAARAYQRADRLAGGRNVEALTGWGEALALDNEAELAGRAGRLFEQALSIDPGAQKALFYGAVAAQRRGDTAIAVDRYTRLLELGPPETVRAMLEQQVAALKSGVVPGAAESGATGAVAAQGAAASAAAAVATIRVRVSAAPGIAASVRAGAPLFVFVRTPGQPGPPLAVKRLGASLPQVVELSSADAMVAGRSFAAGDQVEIVARVSLTGQPTAASGDPFGQARLEVGRSAETPLIIDRLSP